MQPTTSASSSAPADSRPLDTRRRRVLFRAWHRGMKEMDLIYGRFADRELAGLSETEVDTFEALMEEADDKVFGWVVGRMPTPPDFDTPLFARIRDFKLV